ncbi:MAG: FAD-dependent oxidoreductase [Rhodanobacteraceae bacterium]
MSRQTDVLVLGGGVIGLVCAHYLLASGRGVTVLDQGSVGSGASHGNCGTLTPSHAPPLAMPGVFANALTCMFKADAPLRIRPRLDPALLRWLWCFARHCNWPDFQRATLARFPLLAHSRTLIEQLIRDEQLDCEFEPTGTLYVFRDARAFERSRWLPQILGEIDLPIESLDSAGALALEPTLKEEIVGGYFNPRDAHLRPDRYVDELARIVRAKGGMIEENTCIEVIERHAGRVVRVCTSRGDFAGRDVVLALGSWSPRFARMLGLRLPIQPGKGYSITYTRPSRCPRIPLVLKEASVCVTAWQSGYRLGSTMEFAGYDGRLNRTRLDALKRGAAAYLHEPEGREVIEEWYGWRPMTPDDLPMIGRAPGIGNLILATGHGMLGISMSAMTGVLVSEIANDREPSFDISAYDAARFL